MNPPTKPTFHKHGKDWCPHTPGDPCPVDKDAMVFILTKDMEESDVPAPASSWCWDRLDRWPDYRVLGWRYADPQPESTESAPDDEQRLFEAWLERTNPRGDHESIQRQWKSSSDYADFINPAPVNDELASLREENANMRTAIKDAYNTIAGHSHYIHLKNQFTGDELYLTAVLAKLQPFTPR